MGIGPILNVGPHHCPVAANASVKCFRKARWTTEIGRSLKSPITTTG
jgi:hypothetical protein